MTNENEALDRKALREIEAPGELLRRYMAAAGGQVLAFVLLGAGALLLVVGWFGVSREVIVSKQIPFLVSGGLGGAFLLGVGALLMVTHELRLDNRRLAAVEMLVEELRDALLLDEEVPTREVKTTAAQTGKTTKEKLTNGSRQEFAVVGGSSRYHRPTCAAAAGKELTYVGGESARGRGLQPCRLCSPDVSAN